MISSTLSATCFTACLIAAILDFMAAFLLQRTDFTQCAYTSSNTTVSCASPICPSLELHARTCYCCYLYDSRTKGGCNTPLLLAKQTYFSGVDSCNDVTDTLQPMLSAMGGLNLVAAIISMVYVFQSNPILHHKEKSSASRCNQHKGYSNNRIFHIIKMILNHLLCRIANNKDATKDEAANDAEITNTSSNC